MEMSDTIKNTFMMVFVFTLIVTIMANVAQERPRFVPSADGRFKDMSTYFNKTEAYYTELNTVANYNINLSANENPLWVFLDLAQQATFGGLKAIAATVIFIPGLFFQIPKLLGFAEFNWIMYPLVLITITIPLFFAIIGAFTGKKL